MSTGYVPFTEEMKKEYTILIPNMLPMHFKLIGKVLNSYGFKTELLLTQGQQIKDTGLKYCHNDTCYPAILVIGQFIDALQSGKYDPDKVALIMFQTGGGCRASNYINLIRKALAKAGFAHVPVISFSFSGLEKHPGFKLSVPMLYRMMYGVFYGDFMATEPLNPVKDALRGVPFDRAGVAEALGRFDLRPYFGAVTCEEILKLLFDR